jgi:hypothetical protein
LRTRGFNDYVVICGFGASPAGLTPFHIAFVINELLSLRSIALNYKRRFEKLNVEEKLGMCGPWRDDWLVISKDLSIVYLVCPSLFDHLPLNGRSFSPWMVHREGVKLWRFGVDTPCSLKIFGRLVECYIIVTARRWTFNMDGKM